MVNKTSIYKHSNNVSTGIVRDTLLNINKVKSVLPLNLPRVNKNYFSTNSITFKNFVLNQDFKVKYIELLKIFLVYFNTSSSKLNIESILDSKKHSEYFTFKFPTAQDIKETYVSSRECKKFTSNVRLSVTEPSHRVFLEILLFPLTGELTIKNFYLNSKDPIGLLLNDIIRHNDLRNLLEDFSDFVIEPEYEITKSTTLVSFKKIPNVENILDNISGPNYKKLLLEDRFFLLGCFIQVIFVELIINFIYFENANRKSSLLAFLIRIFNYKQYHDDVNGQGNGIET